MNKIINSNL